MHELEQLKLLVFSQGWDEESRQQVLDFEHQLSDLAEHEKLSDHPVIKPFIDYMQEQIVRCETLLKTDRKLTDRERDALFERIDLCDKFTSIFTGKQRRAVEQSIREALSRAKAA